MLEQGIVSGVRETVDAAGGISLPPPQVPSPTPSASATPTPVLSPEATPGGNARTPNPTQRTPGDTQGYAQKAFSAAKSFLGGIFGR